MITFFDRAPNRLVPIIALTLLGVVVAIGSGIIIPYYPAVIYLFLIAPVALSGFLFIGKHAEWGLWASIFLIVIQRNVPLPVVDRLFTISEMVLLVAATAWLFQMVLHRRALTETTLNATQFIGPFLIYILVAFLSLFNLFQQSNLTTAFAEIFARVYLMVFLLIIAAEATTPQRYYQILMAWIASAVLVAGLTLVALVLREFRFDPLGLVRGVGGELVIFFRNPNALAAYLTGTILAVLPLAFTKAPMTAFPFLRTISRWILPGLLIGLYLTESQGAYVAVAAGLIIWPVVRLSKQVGSLLLLVVLVMSLLAPVVVRDFLDAHGILSQGLAAIGYEANRVPKRLALLESQFRIIENDPINGIGIGQAYSFSVATGEYEAGSHFTVLGIIMETGFLGLAAVSLICFMFLKTGWDLANLNLTADSGWLQVYQGLLLGFIGLLIYGLTHDIQTNRTLWLILALLVALKPAFTTIGVDSPISPKTRTANQPILEKLH